jgi:hypothetical protein
MFLAPSPMLPRACANSSRTHTLLATSHVSHSRLTPASAPFPRTQHAHSLHLEDVRRAAALEVLERVCATHRCTPPAPLRPAPLPMPSSHPRSASSLLQDVRELTEHLRASRLSSPARPLALHAPTLTPTRAPTLTPTRAPTFSPAAPPAASPFSPYASHASARAPTQVCVNLTQVCVNLTQVCVNLTQACANLTQACVNLTQACANLTQACANLTQACANLTQWRSGATLFPPRLRCAAGWPRSRRSTPSTRRYLPASFEWSLNDGQIPNPNIVRVAPGTEYVEGNRGRRVTAP